jgi:hypothetical protein
MNSSGRLADTAFKRSNRDEHKLLTNGKIFEFADFRVSVFLETRKRHPTETEREIKQGKNRISAFSDTRKCSCQRQ